MTAKSSKHNSAVFADQLNIFLMLISLLAAYFAPLDLVLFSYAFLGPAHYITEIVWLEKRNYFLSGPRDYLVLTAMATIFILSDFFLPATLRQNGIASLFAFCMLASLILTYTKDQFFRVILFGMALLTIAWASGFKVTQLIYIFVPTLIHVYVFTGLFILLGALKSKSLWGRASLLTFVGCGLSLLLLEPEPLAFFRIYDQERLSHFTEIAKELVLLFSLEKESSSLSIMAFISFAYTYHYLNWFSKTKVIGWYEVSKPRLVSLSVAYILSISAYLIDYNLGFLLLLFLSILHVILEFPLNFRTIEGLLRHTLGQRKL